MAGGARRGKLLSELAILENSAIVIRDDKIIEVGTRRVDFSPFTGRAIDAAGMAVVPALLTPIPI